MEQLIAQVVTIAKGMWRFRWPALAVAWLVALIGVIIVFRVPDKFEASARVYVDTQSILKPLMAGLAVQPNVEQQVVMLSRTLISRPNMEKLVRMADLDLKSESKAQQDAVVTALMRDVQIKNVGRDNLYILSYQNAEPAKAQKVIQSLVSIFVESSLGDTRKDTLAAKAFLDEQIKSYERKLEEAEAKVKAFKLRNLELALTTEGKDAAGQMGALQEQLRQAKLELREAEQARDMVRQQLQGGKAQGSTPGATTPMALGSQPMPVSTPEIDARIDAQKRNLDALLQRFTEQHPDVISTRRLIRDLEDQKREEVKELQRAAAAAAASAPMGGGAGSMMAQEMSRMLAATEVQVASLKARVAEFEGRYASAREFLKTAPQLEAEAAQLNRDYEIQKRNYESLVSRRESATMSGELEGAAGMADFRLIDPPRVSPTPVAPNRLLLLPMAFVIALGAGFFVAFAGSQLRPVFHSAGDLRAKVAIPLLGVVSKISNAAELRRERMSLIRFMVGSGGLVGTFIVIFLAMSFMAMRRAG
ncbi:MAG: Wzz/FepE/Etk N-terminal domain-containing protein [Burkholderiaceae bacterium]|jgi:polysaccharide chain length determinant protein (PEP-CTERM system associated)|nr:Wzz/FepE/Etk N-terminal domain-containing protein [Burkholderiaceae bacterium]